MRSADNQTRSKPSYPVPTVVEILETDYETGLVTFKHKRKIHVWPIDEFEQAFPSVEALS